jgi:hypothetical protein
MDIYKNTKAQVNLSLCLSVFVGSYFLWASATLRDLFFMSVRSLYKFVF